VIHARPLSKSFYDEKRFGLSGKGVAYLQAIFSDALGSEDLESQRPLFDTGNLVRPYDSVNFHISKRIRRLTPEAG
jgi:hypothetical protein